MNLFPFTLYTHPARKSAPPEDHPGVWMEQYACAKYSVILSVAKNLTRSALLGLIPAWKPNRTVPGYMQDVLPSSSLRVGSFAFAQDDGVCD
jgi:hypothetical protein